MDEERRKGREDKWEAGHTEPQRQRIGETYREARRGERYSQGETRRGRELRNTRKQRRKAEESTGLG